ncbi:MAG: TRAP transporter substrate-binding protein [Bacillota bacterium]
MFKLCRKLLMISLLVLLVISLVGCSAGEKSSGQSSEQKKEEKIVLKYGDAVSTADPQYKASVFFAEKVAEKTGGRVEIQIYPNSQLGSQREMTEGLKLGTIEIVKNTNAVFTGFVSDTKILDLPYLFKDTDHARRVLDGEVGDQLKAAAEKAGYKVLWFFTPRSRSVYNSVKPIFTPNDMQGLKIRVMESPIMIDTINSMGGNAVPLAFGEVYSALEQGVIDGAENSVISYYAMKHSEVSKYFSETKQFYSPELVIMSLDKFKSLPEDVQKVFEELAGEVVAYEHKVYQELEDTTKEQLINEGSQFNEVDLDAFRAKMEPLYQKHAKDVGGMDLINKILNY